MGRRQSKDPSEHYRTPDWVIDRLMDAVWRDLAAVSHLEFLDPCVGPQGDVPIPERVGEYIMDATWRACDPAHNETTYYSYPTTRPTTWVEPDDYLDDENILHAHRFGACVMNPPFSRALEFAQRAVEHCRYVFMLQRLNWLASQERHPWLSQNTPSVFVLPNRPDFTGGGGDSHDYAWFGWGYERPTVRILDVTPRDVRRPA